MHPPSEVVVSTTAVAALPRADGRVTVFPRARATRRRGVRQGFAGSSALRVGIVIAGLGLAGGVARYYLVRHAGDRPFVLHGVLLGMTPSDVRDRFVGQPQGVWHSEMRADPVLVWTAPGTTASFEFHGGILVAVRMLVRASDPAAQGRSLDVSNASVLVRRLQTDGRVEVTLLARDCPTHAEEVRRLIPSR